MSSSRLSGIATVMFTDLEGSTETTTRLGDDAAASLFAQHDRIVRDAIAAHRGRQVRSTGDGFLVLFDSARGAVACALAIQRELAQREDGLRVRIGIGAGEVQEDEDEGEPFGAAINLAARVMDRADGGQVLMTDAVRQLVGTMPGARFRDRGRVALKGFPARQHLHEVLPAEGLPKRRAPRRKSRRPIIAAAALAIAVIAPALALIATGGAEALDVRPNSVAILDPDDGHVIGQVPVGVRPADLAVGAGSVWVANLADESVTQIGARSRRVVSNVAPGINIDGIGVGPSGVWVADNARRLARVIDPVFHSVTRSVPAKGESIAGSPRPVAVSADGVWIASALGLARIDPDSGRTIATAPIGIEPNGVAVGAGGVWVSDGTDGTVTRVDPENNDVVETIPVGEGASGVAAGAGGVWVAVPLEDRVKRIDPATNAITDSVPIEGGPGAVAIGGGAVWVTSRRGGTVTRIDPADPARVTHTIRLGHSLQGVAVTKDAVWVAVQASPPEATAGGAPDVLTVLRPEGLIGGTDPLVAFNPQEQYATCGMLLNYPERPYPAGARLQPELAAAMPTVTDGGRTYTYRVRRGLRFSPPSGAPVTADAFRHAIERATQGPGSWVAGMLSDVVGVTAYNAKRAEHIAGVTARGDTLTIRLKARSPTLLTRLATAPLCAVPPTTPMRPGTELIPSAGPYYNAEYVPRRHLLLKRNPNYDGPRHARMRAIDVELDVGRTRAVAAVDGGRADYLGSVPVERVAGLDRDYGAHSDAARAGRQRYFSGPNPVLNAFVLNTRRPLFARKRMRRAVNFALDRRALARIIGGSRLPSPGRPTDQFIPPDLLGFRDAAIYPLASPDLERARRLAGKRRLRAALYTCGNPACVEQGRVARRNLAAIGIDLEVKTFSLLEMFRRLRNPGEPWDMGFFGFAVATADPSDFIAALYTPLGGDVFPGGFSDKALGRRLRAALPIADPADREHAFAELDAAFARAGAAAPFATGVSTDFFSDRIGCQIRQPIYGISLGALCVRP